MEALAFSSIERLSNISVRVKDCKVHAMHEFVMSSAPIERFVYITKGEVCIDLKSRELFAGDRDMIYLPRNTAYRSRWLCDSKFVVVDITLCDENGDDIPFGDTPCVLFNDSNRVYEGLLAALGEKAESKGPFDWIERLHLSFKLLCEIARSTTLAESEEKRISQGVLYLENNYAEDFSIDLLAKMCSISSGHFRKLFMTVKGTTPSDYRNRLRIQKALELLKSGNYTVGEAAEKVGVSDIKYFGKLFFRYTGIKPSEIKKNH